MRLYTQIAAPRGERSQFFTVRSAVKVWRRYQVSHTRFPLGKEVQESDFIYVFARKSVPVSTMAREYDHLFKLLIIGDSGELEVTGNLLKRCVQNEVGMQMTVGSGVFPCHRLPAPISSNFTLCTDSWIVITDELDYLIPGIERRRRMKSWKQAMKSWRVLIGRVVAQNLKLKEIREFYLAFLRVLFLCHWRCQTLTLHTNYYHYYCLLLLLPPPLQVTTTATKLPDPRPHIN